VKRSTVFAAVVLVLAGSFSAPNAVPVDAAGICHSLGNYHIWHGRNIEDALPANSEAFDRVQGEATVRNLDICIGNNGGTFVLPANVDNEGYSANPLHFQAGYGRAANIDSGALRFYYAGPNGNPHEWCCINPVVGTRYRFIIWRSDSGLVNFRRYRLDGGTWVNESTIYTSWAWPASTSAARLTHAWWGCETWDQVSDHGPHVGNGSINMAYLGYSTDDSGSISYRTDMANPAPRNFSGWGDNHHGHVGDWVYNNDMINCETH
jgi:hypothetical protein